VCGCNRAGWNGHSREGEWLPLFVQKFAPDALWALLIFVLTLLLQPQTAPRSAAIIALTFSFLIEGSQLVQAPALHSLRATTPGGLVLGHGFLWSDLLCYMAGIAIGFIIHASLFTRRRPSGQISSSTQR
jgi:hypothetical protein